MGKKKISGQTVAIIVLAILLLLTACFGGVFAYYSTTTDRVYGRVTMANLRIDFQVGDGSGESGQSNVFVSDGIYLPGQHLENSPLTVINESNTPIYLAVVYKVNVFEGDVDITDALTQGNPLAIDVGAGTGDSIWTDYLFSGTNSQDEVVSFRCLITTTPIASAQSNVTVIAENALRLPASWGNELQSKKISFSFQAYAIGSNSLSDLINSSDSNTVKCQKIMSAIFEAFDYNISI